MPPLTFAEMMDFTESHVEEEDEKFSGEMPNHGAELLTASATDLLQTLVNCKVLAAEDTDETVDEASLLAKDAVDVLLALGVVQSEHGLNIEEAFLERMDEIRTYKKVEEGLESAETHEERMAVFEEYLDEDELAQMLSAGTNVDNEHYNPTDVDRTFQ